MIKMMMTITMTNTMMAKGKNHCTDKETLAKSTKNTIMTDGNGNGNGSGDGDGDGKSNGNSNSNSNGNGNGNGNATSTDGSGNAMSTPPPSHGNTKKVSAQAKLIAKCAAIKW